MTPAAHRIRDTAPAAGWEDAFLSGNGELGLMVYGHPHAERIVVNHHRLVLPNGTRHARAPELADRMPWIRDLVLAGRRAEAAATRTCPRTAACTGPSRRRGCTTARWSRRTCGRFSARTCSSSR